MKTFVKTRLGDIYEVKEVRKVNVGRRIENQYICFNSPIAWAEWEVTTYKVV